MPPARESAAAAGLGTWPVLICLLGDFRLLRNEQAVPLRDGGKIEALLCMLALASERGVPRETLLMTLWPKSGDAGLASQSLNSLVYSVHRLLGAGPSGRSGPLDRSDRSGRWGPTGRSGAPSAPPVVRAYGTYRLNVDAGIGVDVTLFERLAGLGDQQERAGQHAAAMQTYRHAIQLYQGDLRVGADVHADVQAIVERERLRALHLTLLARLSEHAFEERDYTTCLEFAQRLLMHDPCREDAHRTVMRCFVRRGERAQALRQYRTCEAVLHAEFDTPPEPPTRALFDQIRLDPQGV
jgi:DNA-binding SARP family transcriptional activator